MKNIMKVTQGKRFLSLVLAVVMMATVFNIALPMLKLKAEAADITIGGVSQTRVVSNYATVYEDYAAQYLNGASNPTNIVIPGLNAQYTDGTTDKDDPGDYVIQGMTYYPQEDWMLVTAYHNDGNASSKVFCLDAKTGDFVAMFDFYNPNSTTLNTEHGGGIAISENNIYYACGDDDNEIAYAPLSALDGIENDKYRTISLVDSVNIYELGKAYTAYVCYDEGVLWTGNFYDRGTKVYGIYEVAAEYNVPANSAANSMVFGYKLEGTDSSSEWKNFKSLVGSPSYSLALSNVLKDVQYAVVDNGKLYLSRSYGSGAGNSVNFGFGDSSWLTIADIDLSQPGTKLITINNSASTTTTVMAHAIENYDNYPMMPMSEGLCVIDGDIFITFEGASNKYLHESGEGTVLNGLNTKITNCEKPVDVIWQLDPYKLMEIEKAEPENSIYYERVYDLTDIKDGEEYIILYESSQEDSVTQKNILYAFDAFGNFNGHKLSKGTGNDPVGYDGMIGHPITSYSIENIGGKDRLYLSNPEYDDVENVRWTISNISGTNYSIKNTSTYFANNNNLFVDSNKITMAPSGATYLPNLILDQLVDGSGYFVLSNGGLYYLWCNDGSNATRNTNIESYYKNKESAYPIFSGVTETPGTFHCDALNMSGANTIGASIDKGESVTDLNERYKEGAFQIYHRVVDNVASTYESRVYTDLKAELQADGTYTIDLETYAIGPNHYQYVGERPTDYIIVADMSNTMKNGGSTGISPFSGDLSVGSLCNENDTKAPETDSHTGVHGYAFYNPKEDIYYLYNGEYYKIYLAIHTTEVNIANNPKRQKYWAYFIDSDGLYHILSDNGGFIIQNVSEADFKYYVDNEQNISGYCTDTGNGDRQADIVYTGPHYRFDDINSAYSSEHNSIDAMKTVVSDLIGDIADQNPNNRIAFVKYGDSSSYLSPTSGWVNSGFTDAFWPASSGTSITDQLSYIDAAEQSDNNGMELQLAKSIIENSNADYSAPASENGRSVAVIFLSDGIPGKETTTTKTENCNPVFDSASTSKSDADSAADKVIATAREIKNKGAFIYTVLFGNNSAEDFNKKAYMEAVSSKYAAAQSMSNRGGESNDGIEYALTVASTTLKNFVNFGLNATKQVEANNTVSLANLDESAILRQELSDSFNFTEASYTVEYIPGEFDAIGRFSFNESQKRNVGDEITVDGNQKELTVTGFNYSTQYIAKNKDNSNKLRVRVTGVLADETKSLDNVSISNTSRSALYQNKTQMANEVMFKQLPTSYINIPTYTYVLDYGLQLLDTDVNGTLCAVSNGLTKQDPTNYNKTSQNGLVEIQKGNENLLYTPNPALAEEDSGYVLIKRDDGTYDWFEIEVAPASNVYYEETSLSVTNDNDKSDWGTEAGGTSADNRKLPEDGDVDGYDKAYDNSNKYSNGTTLSTTVSSTNKRSDTASVTFKGNGFDLVSACGADTGVQLVSVKQKGKTIKAYIIDTYYEGALISDSNPLVTQVPIVNWRTDTYGEYTVETAGYYLSTAGALKTSGIKNNLIDTGLVMNSADLESSYDIQQILDEEGIDAEDVEVIWFDDNSILNGGSGARATQKTTRDGSTVTSLKTYVDGFRVYNPLGGESDLYADSEKNASYVNVLENLATVENDLTGIGFVTGSLADGGALTFANYETVGPKGEFYLQANQSVTFKVNINSGDRVMLGLRAVNGATTINVNDIKNVTINSATEMFYDISESITTVGEVNITIANGSGILAINQVKFSGGSTVNNNNTPAARSVRSGTATAQDEAAIFLPLTEADLVAVENTLLATDSVEGYVKNGVIVPVVEEEPEIPEDNTTPDNGGDDNNNESNEETTILSLFEVLMSFISELIEKIFSVTNIF